MIANIDENDTTALIMGDNGTSGCAAVASVACDESWMNGNG